jgi:sterol desaturase/sphingolipid hydroxylase (fatty acid hydroxylase superfamily)
MTEFFALTDPARRLFSPQLLAAAMLAGLVWWVRVRPHRRTSLTKFLFARSVWLHPSALLDYRFLVVRAVLAAVLLVPAWWSSQKLAVWLGLELTWAIGRGPLGDVDRGWVIAAFSVSAFVLNDFFRYLAHRASHRFEPLWAIHQVHHSAEVLTPFTLNRTHPLEGLLMRAVSALALGLCGGVCAWLFRGRVSAWEIAGRRGRCAGVSVDGARVEPPPFARVALVRKVGAPVLEPGATPGAPQPGSTASRHELR